MGFVVKDHFDVVVGKNDVFYLEKNDVPGLCTGSAGKRSWTPIKISKRRVRTATSDTSDEDIDIDDCVSLDYQPVSGVPGFEIETKDGIFWAPIAHRTRTRLKSADT